MSVDKFKFVSPGVFANEIDESILPKTPEEMGPVIIGRALRGPVMRPVKVGSFAEFVEIFGEPVAGGTGGDVWRDGNKTSPTYGAYAAQAYLKNSGPITFVRLAGFDNADNSTNPKPGWAYAAYGLFVFPTTKSAENVYNVTPNATGTLAAIFYGESNSVKLAGAPLSGSSTAVEIGVGKFLRGINEGKEFKLITDTTSSVNFIEDSKKYIRDVMNTNPTLVNSDIVSSPKSYFLGETFKTAVDSLPVADGYAAVLSLLVYRNATYLGSFEMPAQSAKSSWVVSQHKGEYSTFVADPVSGEYPVQKLFKFFGLTEGEWHSKNIKISIEDIKESTNKYNKFGSFTVSLRKMEDTDVNPQYIERFVGCNLDPSSENFIAKKIGDKYTEWDYENKLWKEYGTYNNKSKFIRVEVEASVASAQTAQDLLPYGFYGPRIYKNEFAIQTSASNLASGLNLSAGSFINTTVYATISSSASMTASFELPKIPTYVSSSDSLVSSLPSLYWGIKTNEGTTKRFNKDIMDYLREPNKYASDTDDRKYSFFFSLDDVSASVNNGVISSTSTAVWKETNRSQNKSITSLFTTGSDGSSTILSTFNKFTLPLVGGFDGVNIKEKDPFNKRVLNSSTGYARNSVKMAIEGIADPEVVEMNLAAIPGVDNEALTSLLIEKCETRGDALAIIDLNGDYVPEEGKASATTTEQQRKPNVNDVVRNLKERALNSSYGCAFFPWVLAKDTINNNTLWLPSSAIALGTFSSSQKKTELWFAPAGFNRGGLSDGAAGLPVLQTALRLSSKDRDKLYEANINPIATFPSEGIVVFGQKTLQVTPSALDRINVRRLMIYVKKEISRMASTVLFDPNIEVTWKRFTNKANPFLDSVKTRFGLTDFKVVLDSTTTTPDLVDRNIVYAKIFLKPARAIEFIALDFVIANTGASFSD